MKKILLFCILAIGFGFAQELVETPPAPAPEPEATSANSASPFDAVRGHSYNPYGITGAASSVYDLVLTPSDIYGKRFFYVSPLDEMGFASFGLFGGSAMLGLSNDVVYDSPNLVLGFATPAFGAALVYSVSKQWTELKTEIPPYTITNSARYTLPGDKIGLYFSMPLGSATAYANLNWITDDLSYTTETEGSPLPENNYETQVDYSTIDFYVGILGSLGALNYDANLNIQRTGGTMTSTSENFSSMGDKVVTRDSRLDAFLNLNVSYAALQSSTARVLVGSNNGVLISFLDEVDAGAPGFAGGSLMALVLTPNILGEVVLAENWLAFAGAKHDIGFIFGAVDPDDARDENYSETTIGQTPTEAFLGIRYYKKNWAIEAQIAQNPFVAFNGQDFLINFGGFIYF